MTRAPNFNRLAGAYRWMERLSFGPFLALCRFTCLDRAQSCRHALVLGDGDGRFTARLLRVNPGIQVDAVDASASMLRALTRRAAPDAARLRTHLADARDWSPAHLGFPLPDHRTSAPADPRRANGEPPPHPRWSHPSWDVVATHFFLDCLTTAEIQSLAARLRPTLTPTALWIVSEFAVPSNLYGRLVARPLIAALYRAFGLLTGLAVRTLPDHPAALRAAGFTLVERRTRLAGLLVSELWSVTPSNPALPPTQPG